MRRRGRLSLLAVLVLCAATVVSVAAWGKVSLWQDGGEAQWWYIGAHKVSVFPEADRYDVCGTVFEDACSAIYGDQWGVELATGPDIGDWAYVALDCAQRFNFGAVHKATLAFTYKMIDNPIYHIGTNSGPRLAFWLLDPAVGGKNYIVISGPAPIQTDSCTSYVIPSTTTWSWGEAETETKLGEEYVDPAIITPGTGSPGLLSTVPGAYANYVVRAVLVLMGPVGSTGTPPVVDSTTIGQAVVDNVVLGWTTGTPSVAYGGTYHLEKEWTQTITFDDWTSTSPTDPKIPPAEWAKWCTDPLKCPHCLPVDDQNLWTIVKETDFPTSVPTAAKTFPSGDYAIYFGTKSVGNYDLGEAVVGTVCSPWNEVNPADKYVSLSFDYFRQVESYMGEYDWTYVQVAFDSWGNLAWDPWASGNGSPADARNCPTTSDNWKTVWYKDSSDVSTGAWEQAVITHYVNAEGDPFTDETHRILIPPMATRMRIRFGFNSVDGASNNYLGWIIDNVVKTHSPEPSGCRIITENLPQGEVNDKYPAGDVDSDGTVGNADPDDGLGVWLDPRVIEGSLTGARSWSIDSVTKDGVRATLPRRLSFDPAGHLYGELDPGTAGTYVIKFLLLCHGASRPQEKTLVLNVRAAQTGLEKGVLFHVQDFDANDSWTTVPGAEPACGDSTTTTGLWHQTSKVRYALDSSAVMAEYGSVGYFGKDDYSTTDDPNYACARSKGCMTSPTISVGELQDGEELIVGFKSWRNVEPFAGGEYDKTWVEVRTEGGNWVVVWTKSSKDPSLAAWTWEEARTGIILKRGTKIQIRFCFDSIDGYKNGKDGEAYGWLVDEISLYAGGAELAITSCPRGDTSVGEYYNEEIGVAGGTAITPKWEISAGALPPGIGLVEDATDGRTAFVSGIARTEGRYDFTIRVRDAVDSSVFAVRPCTIVVTRNVTLLFEDFENDPAWGGTGLWHYTTDGTVTVDPVKGVDNLDALNHAAYYGHNDDTDPDYQIGARTDGMLTLVTPVISLTGIDAVRVQFDYWREVENFGNGGYDKTFVQVKLGDGDWKTIWERDSGDPCVDQWIHVVDSPTDVDDETIPVFLTGGASTMLIRFVFDSVDKWYNNYIGWLVDNIKIQSAPTTGANPLSVMSIEPSRSEGRDTPAELQVINVPNPITDVHTTTFMVRSPDVEAMRIQIFDLAGSLVYEEEVLSNELVWHTDNDYGEYLANGIYLYRASVLINGEWVETTVQKLVILR